LSFAGVGSDLEGAEIPANSSFNLRYWRAKIFAVQFALKIFLSIKPDD